MRSEYTHKVIAFWLGAVTLLSIAFASTEDRAVASKIEVMIEASKTQLVAAENTAPVVEVEVEVEEIVIETPVINITPGIDSARWASNVAVTVNSREFRFRSDGLPDHELPSAFLAGQRGYAPPAGPDTDSLDTVATVTALPIDERITLNPVIADEPAESPAGLIGVLVNGTQVYRDSQTLVFDEPVSLEWSYVDICNGHPNSLQGTSGGVGGYHYHAVPSCTTDSIDVEGQHSSIVGFLIDGFPVYGSNDEGGVPIRRWNLDQCSGHFGPTPEFPEGIYHYHFLDEVSIDPFPCLTGVLDSRDNFGASPNTALSARVRFGE